MKTLFDEFVKKQFDGYRPEVPAHIWENIEAAQRRKKRAPFWIFANTARMVAAVLILTAGAAVLYVGFSKGGKENSHAEQVATAGHNDVDQGQLGGLQKSNADQQPIQQGNVTIQNKPADSRSNNNGTADDLSTSNPITTIKTDLTSSHNKHSIKGHSTISITGADVQGSDAAGSQNVLTINVNDYDHLQSGADVSGSLVKNIDKIKPTGNIPCPPAEKNAAGNKTYLEIYGGPDYAFKSYSDTSGSAYLQQRKGTLSPLFAFSAGFRYTRVFNNGTSFRTGINYSQVNDRFRYVKGNVIHNIYITNTGGDTTGTYTESGTQYQTSTNKQRTIDIPLVLGYELGNGRLHANVNAGAMINISNKQTGYTIDQSGKPVSLTSASTTSYSYKTNAGVALLGAVSLYFKLNDRLHLMAEPYLRYGLSPVTKEDITFKQKNHTAGLRVGLRLDLN